VTALDAADAAALADAADDAQTAFAAIWTVSQRRLGAILVSVMRFDAATMTVHRVFSSDPASYPPGGSKPKRDTDWGRHVLLEGHVFVAEGPAAIRTAFPDGDLILALGARALVNVPLKRAGWTIGTLNILIPRSAWSADEMAVARLLGILAAAASAAPA